MNFVLLAGGGGTRLWPESTPQHPKQFLSLLSEQSLLQDTYARMRLCAPDSAIFVLTSPALQEGVRACLPELPPGHLWVEPEKRDTAAAMGYAALRLMRVAPDEPLMFVPSDHAISDMESFARTVRAAEAVVREEGLLADIGIAPEAPLSTLGYSRVGKLLGQKEGVSVYAFEGHVEKPDSQRASQLISEGALWHANYYTWTPRHFFQSFDEVAPEFGEALHALDAVLDGGDTTAIAEAYRALPARSFDYVVTENLPHASVRILRGTFGWSDIGTWDSLWSFLSPQRDSVVKGQLWTQNAERLFVHAESGRPVFVSGASDLIVVDTPEGLLICAAGASSDIKQVVEQISSQKKV